MKIFYTLLGSSELIVCFLSHSVGIQPTIHIRSDQGVNMFSVFTEVESWVSFVPIVPTTLQFLGFASSMTYIS